MDIRTGHTYATKAEALADGVPESDIAEIRRGDVGDRPIVAFSSGPFKGRRYVRIDKGHLIRVKEVR